MTYLEEQPDPEGDRQALAAGLSLVGCALGAGFLGGVAVTVAMGRIAGWWGG